MDTPLDPLVAAADIRSLAGLSEPRRLGDVLSELLHRYHLDTSTVEPSEGGNSADLARGCPSG